MRDALADHYASGHEVIPIRDERRFDADLRQIFAGAEAATLIEMTAFGTAVVMRYRTTRVMERARREPRARSA